MAAAAPAVGMKRGMMFSFVQLYFECLLKPPLLFAGQSVRGAICFSGALLARCMQEVAAQHEGCFGEHVS